MDYSLHNLNKSANLKNLNFKSFVEKLNLIGLEVDEISYEKMSTNLFLENINLLLKIPANREDLLNEKFLMEELSTIFLFEIYELWKHLKPTYFFLLKKKYSQYQNYSKVKIPSTTKNILTYIIEIQNAQITESPLWISTKLSNLGLKPYNNVTDILNVVFHEWGQNFNLLPLEFIDVHDHIEFEIEALVKSEVYFDQKNISIILSPGTIVLKEKKSSKILSVLGLIRSTFIPKSQDDKNSSFFLEATFYDIHKNELLLNTLNRNISLKYLRRACLQNFQFSFQRILTLFELLTSCQIIPTQYSTVDNTVKIETNKLLSLRKRNLLNFLKIKVGDLSIFQKAGLKIVCETKNEYYFRIPIYRHDLAREIDIIEEYSRFIGYKNFPEVLPRKEVYYTKNLFGQKNFIKNFFLQNGFSEVITNPIMDFENQNEFSVCITNPLNNELSVLRRSLLPKLLHLFELNSKLSYSRNDFFEIGRTFKKVNYELIEQDKLGGIFQFSIKKDQKTNNSDWFIAKGLIENFFLNFGYSSFQIQKVKRKIRFFHPTRSVLFVEGTKILGIFGELSPSLRKEKYSHIRGPIYLFEINLNYLKEWQLTSKVKIFKEYSKYPLISKDLSIVVNKNTDFSSLKAFIYSQSKYLKKITLFDIYFDEKLVLKVNIGIRLEFQSQFETLTNEFVEKELDFIRNKIIQQF